MGFFVGNEIAWGNETSLAVANDRAIRAASKYCDVISYNRCEYSVEDHKLSDNIDKPVIIGEFNFGALDRGMFHTGLKKAKDQSHRAQLYKNYIKGALKNNSIIGAHWSQYQDQATTGRGDGENSQIGFIDICDKPYGETIKACREVGYELYKYRLKN